MIRRLALAPLALALALLPASLPARSASVDAGIGDHGIYQTRLSNGLQVIAIEDPAAPVVHTEVWYRFGSLYEKPGQAGLAHGLEHMMFRGTTDLSSGALDDVAARLGAQINGATNYDYTNFTMDMPADRLPIAMWIEADRMHKLALLPSSWAIEQRAVLNEIIGDQSSPFFNLLSRVRAAAYPNSAEGRTPAGVIADVRRATVSELRAYYHEWYAPNNATLVVAGDVKHEAVFALAQKDFGGIPARTLPHYIDVHPKAATGKTVEAQFPFPFEVLDIAYAVPGDTEPGEPAIAALSSLIPDPLGPFYKALVESNVALELDANEDTQLKGGLLDVFIVLNPGHTGAEAQRIFTQTMAQQLKDGFAPQLVVDAKRQQLAQRAFDADSIAGYADLVGYTYGIVGERDAAEDRRLAALTPESVDAVARQYLASPNVVGHLTPNDTPPKGSSQKSDAGVNDNFSGRAPHGPIVEPKWVAAAVRKPSTVKSTLDPVEFTLANGLKLIVQTKTDRPTVWIGGAIASSPAFDPDGKEGLQRLANSVASFGTAKYSFEQIRAMTAAIGASVNFGQQFGGEGFAANFDQLLGLLADGEEHPAFPERWVQLEREQLANSVQTEQNISGVMANRVFLAHLLAPTDPELKVPTSYTVGAITRNDLVDYAQRYWRPDLTTIAIVGDVTPEQAKQSVEAAFGTWQNQGPKPHTALPPLPPAHQASGYVGSDANQVYVEAGQPAVGRDNPDYDAFTLLTEVLGGPGYFESRLWNALRENSGLVYSVGARIKADKNRGDLEIDLSASPQNVERAIALVRSSMKALQTHPVSASELEEAKIRLASSALLDEGSAQGQLGQISDIAQMDLPLQYYGTLQARYASITPADIQRVAREYLHPNRLITVFSGPPGPWAR